MEESRKKYRVWPVEIDHIRITDSEYTRSRDSQQIKSKTWTFYVNVPQFEFERPRTMAAFEGQNDAIISRYKDLKKEIVNGETVITNATIKAALAPGSDKVEPFISPYDDVEFPSYGDWLVTMGTKFCRRTPKEGTKGMLFGNNMPISDGVQKWKRLNKDGTTMIRQKNNQAIIQTTTDVCCLVVYDGEMWDSTNCMTPGELSEALRYEVDQQISRGLWKLVNENLPKIELAVEEPTEQPEVES